MHLSERQVIRFRAAVRAHYRRHRRGFPWRRTRLPYRILVSEVMLQQTQSSRVEPFYRRFMRRFPTLRALARAPAAAVLREWSGLGYNRRALYLWRAAQAAVRRYGGALPRTQEALQELPGVGAYTAGAVLAFSFDEPVVFVETNIRTVFLHCFFKRRRFVRDRELLPLVEQTLDRRHPGTWYQALMDYGAWLKREHGNENTRSSNYAKQSPFRGSRRQLRGMLLALALRGIVTRSRVNRFCKENELSLAFVRDVLDELSGEGFLRKTGNSYSVR